MDKKKVVHSKATVSLYQVIVFVAEGDLGETTDGVLDDSKVHTCSYC